MGKNKKDKGKKVVKPNSEKKGVDKSAPVKEKKDKKDKKEKKAKKSSEVVKKELKLPKGVGADIVPETGTRFALNSARQSAFEVVMKGVKDGKTTKEIKKELAQTRKENGSKYDLDSAYCNYVLASHPEIFEVYSNGTVKVLTEPVVDEKALEKAKSKKVSNIKKTAGKVKKMREDKKKKKGKKNKKNKE